MGFYPRDSEFVDGFYVIFVMLCFLDGFVLR